MQNHWIMIELSVPGSAVDLVCALLAELGCQGTLVEERKLDTFVVPQSELDPAAAYRLKAYFAEPENAQTLPEKLAMTLQQVPELASFDLQLSRAQEVRMEDWSENWKQHFSSIKIGSRLVIRPSWEAYQPATGEVMIEIDPGMAFGTGGHGTTLLCLEVIAELLERPDPPQSLLDVGTGSGILSLGAAALGCRTILANDIDPDACRVARENAEKNGFSATIPITSAPLEALDGRFDLVVANILAEENLRLKQEFLNHLQPGGWLVLSGILQEKEALVREGFSSLPLRPLPTRTQDEWVCLIYQRD
jgi:ribosomal protein L11 methyltransferase